MNDTELLGAILRGDPAAVDAVARVDAGVVVAAAGRQGVLPLVAERVAAWPSRPPVLEQLRDAAAGFVAADLYRERELRRVLDALAGRGVRAVVFKGAALAYTDYPRPDLRPRDDSDLLVRPDVRETAHHTLIGLGYRPHEHVSGDLVSYQAIYEKRQSGTVVHVVDLHWRVANPQLFADVLSFDECDADAVPIPALGPSARGPSAVHALFLACVHRVAHHRDEKLLIWIYDIHLLASRMSAGEWSDFFALAAERRMTAICRQGLSLAADAFGTTLPAEALGGAEGIAVERHEPSAAFLKRGRTQLSTFVSDLRTLPSWTARARLIAQHVCPSPAYMRQVYAPSSRAPLAALYVWRAVRGAWRWLARA